MIANKYIALSLLGLAAFLALPHAKAVTTIHVETKAASLLNAPCKAVPLNEALPSTPAVEKFTITSSPCSIELGQLAGSSWISQDEMVSWDGHELIRFDRATQQATPIQGTESVLSGKHWVSIVSASPDGHWLVWAGGEDGHSTWNAISIDGSKHRQWQRDESITTPAVAWMQDNRHWVELRVPETQIAPKQWQGHSDNMRARVYSLDSPDVQDFPLQLETPDPSFILPCNCGKNSGFLFTADGRAWLTQDWQTCLPGEDGRPNSREDVYELLPSATTWKLHKSFVYPKADQDRWMFDSAVRSPDGNWIAWRNYAPTGKDKLRLMLSRTDGSAMQTIYQSDSQSGIEPEWSPDSRQIAFTDNGPLGIVTLKLDTIIARVLACSPSKIARRSETPGKFPVAHLQTLLAGAH